MENMKCGFDAAIEFQPFTSALGVFQKEAFKKSVKNNLLLRLVIKFFKMIKFNSINEFLLRRKYKSFWNNIDYSEFVNFLVNNYQPCGNQYKIFPCVTPFWDNTARRGNSSFRFKNPSPKKFGEWVNKVVKDIRISGDEENLIFVNAWNEWAEGNHLEPCQRFGHSYLMEFKKALITE